MKLDVNTVLMVAAISVVTAAITARVAPIKKVVNG